MSTKKKSPKPPSQEKPQPEVHEEPTPELTSPSNYETSSEPATPTITLESLHQEIESLKLTISELQETLARKRRPVTSNGKVAIRDKQTGTVYPSKNNAYQTLLKSGELKSLVDKGTFGDIPKKNTFGWYVLAREWPDRFEEVLSGEKQS